VRTAEGKEDMLSCALGGREKEKPGGLERKGASGPGSKRREKGGGGGPDLHGKKGARTAAGRKQNVTNFGVSYCVFRCFAFVALISFLCRSGLIVQ